MSLNSNEIKNEIIPKNILNKKVFAKELLQELLKKQLNESLTKLESNTNKQMNDLNYTSKYFKEFKNALYQFSAFLSDIEIDRKKEDELYKQEINGKENFENIKITPKKSNEFNFSTNLSRQNNKVNKKIENSFKSKSNTIGLFKSEQLNKHSNSINLNNTIYSPRIKEESKLIKQNYNIMSPVNHKKNQTIYLAKEELQIVHNMGSFIEKSPFNIKTPNTEKRSKNYIKDKNSKFNGKKQVNNITKHKGENEKFLTEYNILDSSKYNISNNSKKVMNKNPKNITKNKKIPSLNNKTKTSLNIKKNKFSKTIVNSDYNKTINLEMDNKDTDKINFKTCFSTDKKKIFNEEKSIQDMIKLVDNVNQNINKLLESNNKINQNKSIVTTSFDFSNNNNTFSQTNYKSTINLFSSNDFNFDKKRPSLKKNKDNHNILLFKSNDSNIFENLKKNIKLKDIKNNDNLILENEFGINYIKTKSSNKKFEENNRYKNERNNKKIDLNPKMNNIKFENSKNNFKKGKHIKNIDIIKIFKNDKKLLKNILKYLKEIEAIIFTSSNNYLNKERISILDNKKEELLKILNLPSDETLEEKINKIKVKFSEKELTNPPSKFTLSLEAKNKLIEFNKSTNIKIYKHDLDKNNRDNKLIIIEHKILFILLGKEEIYSIKNENIFWKKCCDYLIENSSGKLGYFIFEKIKEFKFNLKYINKIENIIKDNKKNIIKELTNNNFLITPLIKEFLEYCGIIIVPSKTQVSLVIKNLENNQKKIKYLNNLKVRYFSEKYKEDNDD